jgi:hypothetical protein
MRHLEYARDGQTLLVVDETRASLVRIADGRIVELPPTSGLAALLVDEEAWIVEPAGEGGGVALHRFAFDGAPLGTPLPLGAPGPAPRLTSAPAASAIWYGEVTTQLTRSADRSEVTAAPLGAASLGAASPDVVIAVTSRRTMLAHRDRLLLVEAGRTIWQVAPIAGARYLDGRVVHDGRSLALLAEVAGQWCLLVVSERDGRDQHRIGLPQARQVCVAARRGAALVLAGPRHLVLLDLRFGRVILEHDEPRALRDVAIDDGGQELALRYADGDGEVVQVSVAELAATPASATGAGRRPSVIAVPAARRAPPAEAEEAAAAPGATELDPAEAPAMGAPAPEPAAPASDAGAIVSTPALPPRAAPVRRSASEVAELLERQRGWAMAVTTAAIARAWDDGRLTWPAAEPLPHRAKVRGVGGRGLGLAAHELAEARDGLARATRELLAHARGSTREANPLHALGDAVGLSVVARAILLLVAAPSIWGELGKLYRVLADDDTRGMCDEQLLVELLDGLHPRAAIADELDAAAPLLRLGLVRAPSEVATRPLVPLVADQIVVTLLRGRSARRELAPLVTVRPVPPPLADLRLPDDTRRRMLADLGAARGPLRLAVRGRVGAGRRTLLARIAADAGRELAVIDAGTLIRSRRTPAARLRQALQQCHALDLVPCIDGLEALPADDVALRDEVREVLRLHPGPVTLRLDWESQPLLPPGHVLVELPALSMSARAQVWREAALGHGLRVASVGDLSDRYAVGPGVIETVCAQVAAGRSGANPVAAPATDAPHDDTPALDAAVRQHLANRLGATATRVTRLATWSQVILPADVQDSLTEFVARIRHRRKVFDQWGFDRLMSTSRGVTALFSGGPGTGKTLVASAIANELNMDLFRVDLSRIMSKWIGETEQNLGRLFDAAEDGNAIILFDEADSLFAKRTEVKTSTDRYANAEVNYLLQRIDTFEGIAILTTNFGTSIDSAFKRRLSLRLTFPFPDDEMRELLWRAHLPPEAPVAADLDLSDIARRYQLSGGYIRNCTLRAAFLAAEEGGVITLDHFERAIRAEFREIGKLADSGVLE